MSTNKNDGGVVVGLFLMVAAISHAMFSAVSYYEKNTKANENQDLEKVRIVRLLSGWANIGNAAIHVLLVIYTLSNMDNQSEYWLKERELGGIEGPVFLTLLNLSAGIGALRGWTMMYSIGWNAFVAATGVLVPIVWPRFLEEGLAEWPYIVVFIWFAIFAMELIAFTSSMTYFALKSNMEKTEKNK